MYRDRGHHTDDDWGQQAFPIAAGRLYCMAYRFPAFPLPMAPHRP